MLKCLNVKMLKCAGFTIIESLVTISIFVLILGAVMGFINLSYKTQDYAWQQSVAVDEARKGIETMVKEIREIRLGDDGSYYIEKAEDQEFIFFSDIDKDGATERVRYFLGNINSGNQSKKCVTFNDGGSCSVDFSNFFSGTMESAQIKISVEGDFGWNNQEYAEIFADGINLGDICKTGCSDCAATWQGNTIFDVTNQALDNNIQFIADSTYRVNDFCDWEETNHAMKANFELNWTETTTDPEYEFKKGVINPISSPIEYPSDQEEITTLSSYVRNTIPIFKYFDENGNEITENRLINTKLIQIYLVVNVDTNKSPQNFELRSSVQLGNLKTE